MAVRRLPELMQFEPEPEDEWQAHCRNVVAMVEGETTPEEPVMAGEVVPVEAEAESEPVVAGEVVPEIVEGEEDVTEPAVASETMERETPAAPSAGASRSIVSLATTGSVVAPSSPSTISGTTSPATTGSDSASASTRTTSPAITGSSGAVSPSAIATALRQCACHSSSGSGSNCISSGSLRTATGLRF